MSLHVCFFKVGHCRAIVHTNKLLSVLSLIMNKEL